MGSRRQIELRKRACPVFGKNFVSDQLMLVFTADDLFVDTTKRDELARLEELPADHPEVGAPLAWHSRLMGYSATAAALRTRLELPGFSSARVRSLCTAYFDHESSPNVEDGHMDPRDSWAEGRSAYPDGAAVTAALSSRRGQASTQTPFSNWTIPNSDSLTTTG